MTVALRPTCPRGTGLGLTVPGQGQSPGLSVWGSFLELMCPESGVDANNSGGDPAFSAPHRRGSHFADIVVIPQRPGPVRSPGLVGGTHVKRRA